MRTSITKQVNSENRANKPAIKLKWLAIGVFWIALWEVIALIVENVMLLPGPWDMVMALPPLFSDGQFYLDILSTIYRCVAAILGAFCVGATLAFLSYKCTLARNILSLPVALFKAVPVMAVVIYMLLLLSSGNVPILVCFIMCFPIVYTNILSGLDAMDGEILEMAKVFRIPMKRQLKCIFVPGLVPQIKASASLLAGLSWKAVVTAEVLSIPKFSLGYELMNAKYYLQTDTLFAYIGVIVALSITFEKLIKLAMSRIIWKGYNYSKIIGEAKGHSGASKDAWDFEENRTSVPVLTLRNINKSFDSRQIINELNLKVESGEKLGIMGPSGVGKTTLLRIMEGMENADSGEVSRYYQRASFLFQEDRLIPWLNVYDNLAIVFGRGTGENVEGIIDRVLEDMELKEWMYSLPEELSGGMKHRIAMARALIYPADIVFMDEPFRGIDEELKARLVEGAWKKGISGKTVVLVTHNRGDGELLADRVIELK